MLWLILAHYFRAQPDSVTEAAMTTLRITDETTRAELEEAMSNIVATLHRMPSHWTDRRAALHAKIRRHARGLGAGRALSKLDAWHCSACGRGWVVPSLATMCCEEWKREQSTPS